MNPNANPAATTRPETAIQAHTAAMQKNLQADTSKLAVARVFRSNIPSMRYVFKQGKVAPFISGRYTTDIAHEIEELDAEIAHRHPNISANKEEIVDTIEPLEALKKKHFEEFLLMQAKTLDKTNDAGTSEQGKLNVANSTTVAPGAAGSDSNGAAQTQAAAVGKIQLK